VPFDSRTTWASQIFSNNVLAGMARSGLKKDN